MNMPLFRGSERTFAESVRRVAYANPFSRERIDAEREALGERFSELGTEWTPDSEPLVPAGSPERPNITLLRVQSLELAESCRARLGRVRDAADADLLLYEDLALYAIFAKYEADLYALAIDESKDSDRPRFYAEFRADFVRLLESSSVRLPSALEHTHVLSLFFQVRRAFHHIFRAIFGAAPVVAHLRASVWESVFTRDLRRYRTHLYHRMNDIPTLVTGESGTGKDLVASAIGLSRYVPFDTARKRFVTAIRPSYVALSVSSLSTTLLESELFGHRRGAFTGATEDRAGWLEQCGEHGTVFLDEIGELAGDVQVKLLRVLQNREIFRIGETTPRRFEGRLVAATNRDLGREVEQGRFRDDLYYRLCADRIALPTLRERLADDPEELERLLRVICRRVAGDDAAPELERDARAAVEKLGASYGWPGNVRELEQCVRSVLVHGTYGPLSRAATGSADGKRARLDQALMDSGLSAEAVLGRYCTLAYELTGSFVEAGKRLGLDRRTVKEHVDRSSGIVVPSG
jgi:transcriptional regulator with AAA-type ATPase domain